MAAAFEHRCERDRRGDAGCFRYRGVYEKACPFPRQPRARSRATVLARLSSDDVERFVQGPGRIQPLGHGLVETALAAKFRNPALAPIP
jgi:hypothetical protein